MVPAYMMNALTIVMLVRLVAGFNFGSEVFCARAGSVIRGLLCVLILAQPFSVKRLDKEQQFKHAEALRIDDDRFSQCARIYFFPASTQSFAFALGDWWTGSRFGEKLAQTQPANDFWFEQNTMDFRDWKGTRDVAKVIASYPCVYFRGTHWSHMGKHLKKVARGFKVTSTCPNRYEKILLSGVDCAGKLVKK